jgi:hypothetical protein
MATGEKLLRKMVPHGCDLTHEVVGGKVEISEFDVAASLAYGELPAAAYILGRAKYCDDFRSLKQLTEHIESFVHKEVKINNWIANTDQVSGIANLVISEALFGVLCKKCNGLGYRLKSSKRLGAVETCEKCNGVGTGTLTQRKRANISQIPLTSWIRHWHARVERFYSYIYDLDDKVVSHINKQFVED